MASGMAKSIARSRPSSIEIRPINTAPITNSVKTYASLP